MERSEVDFATVARGLDGGHCNVCEARKNVSGFELSASIPSPQLRKTVLAK